MSTEDMVANMKDDKLLEIKNLRTHFHTPEGKVRAVDGVNLVIPRNTSVALVGESGSGKSVTSKSIMGLLPQPPAEITGEILYHQGDKSINLLELDPDGDEYSQIRGNEISMIFQDPMTSLNPVFTIGNQIMEVILRHTDLTKAEAKERAIELLDKVGIANPRQRVDEYPHQFSGGMRQRVMIAIGLACNPTLLIADEPTTAIDVTIQAGILELMKELQEEFKTSMLMISHDLGVVAQVADKVAVMYLGEVVEYGDVLDIFHSPQHPYTKALLKSIPILGQNRGREFEVIEGTVPDPFNIPVGCRFQTRCNNQCPSKYQNPPMIEVKPGHITKCWLYKEDES